MVAGILKVAWKAVRDVHTAEIHSAGMEDEEENSSVWELREKRDCDVMGTVCRRVVLSAERKVVFGEYDGATWSCSGLICSVLQAR